MPLADVKRELSGLATTVSETFYCSRVSLGAAVLALLMVTDPTKGALGVGLALAVQYLGTLLRADVALLQSRLLALNGFFLGLAQGSFFQITPHLFILAGLSSLLLAGLVIVMDRFLKTWDLPLGVASYGPALMIVMLVSRPLPWVVMRPLVQIPSELTFYEQIIFGTIRAYAQVFFLNDMWVGVGILLALALVHWRLAGLTLAAGLLASTVAWALQLPAWQIERGLSCFPAILVASTVFVKFRGFTMREAILASMLSPVLEAASLQWSDQLQVPVLAVAYPGLVWLLCLLQPHRGTAAQTIWGQKPSQKWL